MTQPTWLPALVPFDGDWSLLTEYVDLVYDGFVADFVRRAPPVFQGVRVSLRRRPEFEGKSYTFWHLVTEGQVEASRYPVIPRCERIRWPRAILEHAGTDPALHIWGNRRRSDDRMLVSLPDFDYLVVLQERGGPAPADRYNLLLTAYPVEQAHQRAKLRKECEAWASGATKS